MSGWVKLHGSITESTIWLADYATRIVWVTMLAKADADGFVDGSVPGFARAANVTVEEMRAAIATLSAPDPDSRTPDHDGRRIEAVPGGWRILNYRAYRDRGQGKAGSRAPYYRDRRSRMKAVAQQSDVARNTEAEAEAEAEAEIQEQESPSANPRPRAEDVQELWNELVTPPIPRCQTLTPPRRRAAENQLKQRGLDGIREVFLAINASPFLRGENDRGWRPDFLWALKLENIAKVLEGKYAPISGRERTHRSPSTSITGPERERAVQIRRAWGRCQHDPRCESYAACVGVIARQCREQEGAA